MKKFIYITITEEDLGKRLVTIAREKLDKALLEERGLYITCRDTTINKIGKKRIYLCEYLNFRPKNNIQAL